MNEFITYTGRTLSRCII